MIIIMKLRCLFFLQQLAVTISINSEDSYLATVGCEVIKGLDRSLSERSSRKVFVS